MKPYKNASHDSGVVAYEIKPHGIIVKFKDGDRYLYDDKTTGHNQVEIMKALAQQGRGLSTYISMNVKKNYALKF